MGSKNHLIVDKFVISEGRQWHKNLFMAWLDIKKAYDSVSHDQILLEWLKNKIFKQGIGIAEKSLETSKDRWGW